MNRKLFILFALPLIIQSMDVSAAKLVGIKVIDKDYIMAQFKDGDVEFVDDGLGSTAYTSDHDTANNYVVLYGSALDTTNAVATANWTIKSATDANYGTSGLHPDDCYRKSKLNGMAEMDWDVLADDWHYEYTMEHTVYLHLPYSLVQGSSYTIEINANTNSDVLSQALTFDIFNSRSEAVHVNLVGYLNDDSIKAADLYMWMGDGGARDYSGFEGNTVYLYNVNTSVTQAMGTVTFWKSNGVDVYWYYNLTASDVWNIDFTGFTPPGTYRLAVEGVGCSEDFQISPNAYFEPFRVSTLGYFYMRIGQDNLDMTPVPRRPLYIPNVSPSDTKVYITTMSPIHPDWGSFTGGDVWDNPSAWAAYVKPGSPQNNNAYGGHSDALDWDRHLGHISNIYDMLLPYLLTDGKLNDDDLGIAESGNGIPDILDEARNEVDFWLRLRDGDGYSHGLTNPTGSNVLYQAGNTPIAAWANAANASMLANCFMLAGLDSLKDQYIASAVEAYNYASGLPDPMLNETQECGYATFRGKDLKMTAAAFLYNVTGNTAYENMVNSLSDITSTASTVADSSRNQLYAAAGYLMTRQTVHYPALFNNMKASIIDEAKNREANYISSRPTRRAADDSKQDGDAGYFKTIQNVQRCLVAHAAADSPSDKELFENAIVLEADWGLGRNSMNIIYMTTATTNLASKRSIENAYTSGRDDGSPGLHPGHTPYLNTDNWWTGMIMGKPSWMTEKCYPDFGTNSTGWPKAESYFNTRYVWAHSEFTPQQTMRGKMALYAYLYGAFKENTVPGDFEPDGDVDLADLAVLAGEWLETGTLITDIYPSGGDGTVNLLDFAEFARYWQTPAGP